MEYKIKFKHMTSWFWKKIQAAGHSYNKEIDKLIIFKKDGSIEEIPEWSKCYVKLDTDFILAQKKDMEKESGIDIKLNV